MRRTLNKTQEKIENFLDDFQGFFEVSSRFVQGGLRRFSSPKGMGLYHGILSPRGFSNVSNSWISKPGLFPNDIVERLYPLLSLFSILQVYRCNIEHDVCMWF